MKVDSGTNINLETKTIERKEQYKLSISNKVKGQTEKNSGLEIKFNLNVSEIQKGRHTHIYKN